MRKAIQQFEGRGHIHNVYVHKIGEQFSVCELEDGRLRLFPTDSITFVDPPTSENENNTALADTKIVRPLIAALILSGMMPDRTCKHQDDILKGAFAFADRLIDETNIAQ